MKRVFRAPCWFSTKLSKSHRERIRPPPTTSFQLYFLPLHSVDWLSWAACQKWKWKTCGVTVVVAAVIITWSKMKRPGKELNFSSVPIQLWYLPRWISILPEGAKTHFLFIAAITNEVNLGSEKALREFLLKNKTKPLTSKAKLSLKNYNNLNSEKHVDRIQQKNCSWTHYYFYYCYFTGFLLSQSPFLPCSNSDFWIFSFKKLGENMVVGKTCHMSWLHTI